MSGEGSGRRGGGSDIGPPQPTSVMAYAVQTRTCTYLLDDAGICHWIMAPAGVVPSHVQQCIGAQFVACLAFDTPGGLVPELTVGARALFVRHVEDRLVLLRTGPILALEDQRESSEDLGRVELPRATPSARGPYAATPDSTPTALRRPPRQEYGRRDGAPVVSERPTFGRPVVESSGDEQTISVTYRPR
ncbi:MAG: hypothetical protein HY908_36515 [Myxococcales bacterium]|nr:hypothetical protein [Myxococcales bacterium]